MCQDLPIKEELTVEFDEVITYRKKVEQLNISRVDFLHQVTTNRPMDDSRAERVWRVFEEQLETGAVEFADNGTFLFAHHHSTLPRKATTAQPTQP